MLSLIAQVTQADYSYKIGDKIVLNNKAAHKYDTPYNRQFEITKCWTNQKVTLQMGATKSI